MNVSLTGPGDSVEWWGKGGLFTLLAGGTDQISMIAAATGRQVAVQHLQISAYLPGLADHAELLIRVTDNSFLYWVDAVFLTAASPAIQVGRSFGNGVILPIGTGCIVTLASLATSTATANVSVACQGAHWINTSLTPAVSY